MTRTLLTAALALAAIGFGTASEAKAQYTVYIWNMNANNGWVRSGFAHDVFTTKQACLNSIDARVRDNVRWRTDWEAFAVVRTAQRPGPGFLNLQNVPGGWAGAVRYNPRANPKFQPVNVKRDPAGSPADRDNPLFRRETDVVNV